jgi:hypothetical protein
VLIARKNARHVASKLSNVIAARMELSYSDKANALQDVHKIIKLISLKKSVFRLERWLFLFHSVLLWQCVL